MKQNWLFSQDHGHDHGCIHDTSPTGAALGEECTTEAVKARIAANAALIAPEREAATAEYAAYPAQAAAAYGVKASFVTIADAIAEGLTAEQVAEQPASEPPAPAGDQLSATCPGFSHEDPRCAAEEPAQAGQCRRPWPVRGARLQAILAREWISDAEVLHMFELREAKKELRAVQEEADARGHLDLKHGQEVQDLAAQHDAAFAARERGDRELRAGIHQLVADGLQPSDEELLSKAGNEFEQPHIQQRAAAQ